MHIDQARVVKAALEQAIAEAEQAGTTEVAFGETLDATLEQAVDGLLADIAAKQKAAPTGGAG